MNYFVWMVLFLFSTFNINKNVCDYLVGSENETPIITEINYSYSSEEFVLNYVELYNLVSSDDVEKTFISVFTDGEVESKKSLSNQPLFNKGFILVSCVEDYDVLPDLFIGSVTFNESILLELVIELDGEDFIFDSVLLTTIADSEEGFVINEGNNISISRIDEYGEYINTNDYKNDFSLASPTPINSALTVAMYIMEEDTPGQAQYKQPIAKEMLKQLSAQQLDYFRNDNHYLLIEARERYENWSSAVGDVNPYDDRNIKMSKSSTIVIIILLVGLLGICYIVFKRQVNK